jgi:hypothetical protein
MVDIVVHPFEIQWLQAPKYAQIPHLKPPQLRFLEKTGRKWCAASRVSPIDCNPIQSPGASSAAELTRVRKVCLPALYELQIRQFTYPHNFLSAADILTRPPAFRTSEKARTLQTKKVLSRESASGDYHPWTSTR